MAKRKSAAEELFRRALRRKPLEEKPPTQAKTGNAPSLPHGPSAPAAPAAPLKPTQANKNLEATIARLFPPGQEREAMERQIAAGLANASATKAEIAGAATAVVERIAATLLAEASAEQDIARLVRKQQLAAKAVALVKQAKDREIADLAAQVAALQQEAREAGASIPISIGQGVTIQPITDVYPGQAPSPTNRGMGILIKANIRTPHTYRTAAGKTCDTDAWIVYALLVYDASKDPLERGGYEDPWFGMEGPKFRCYYPNSSLADFESIMSTASSGRWLHAYSQWKNYVKF